MRVSVGPLFRTEKEAARAVYNLLGKWRVIPSERRPGWWTIVEYI